VKPLWASFAGRADGPTIPIGRKLRGGSLPDGGKGKPRGERVAEARFNADPNRIAAAIAMDWIQERYEARRERRRKVVRRGAKTTMHDAAAQYAVAVVLARSPESVRKLRIDKVKALLRAGRSAWPLDGGLP
jgi:hypothetical protein